MNTSRIPKALSVDEIVALINKHLPGFRTNLWFLVEEMKVLNKFNALNEYTLKAILLPMIENNIEYHDEYKLEEL